MVEFALVLPLLLLVLFGIIQFGIAFNHSLTLTDATRVGARKAAVSRTALDPEGTARQAVLDAANDLEVDQLHVDVHDETWAPGSDVTVTATYPYSINIFGIPVKSGVLTSKVTERVE